MKLLLAAAALAALGCATLPPPHDGWSTVVAGGASVRNWGDLGAITGRGFGTISFDKTKVRSDTLSLLGELSLYALTQTPEDPNPPDVCRGGLAPSTPLPQSYSECMKRYAQRFITVYGLGVSPVGLSLRLVGTRSTRWDLDALGGGALFNHDVPFPGAMPFSFTASVGTSATFGATWPRGSVVSVGYRLEHFSNAGLARPNPAIGAQTLVIRWSP